MKKQLWILFNLCAAVLVHGERLTPQQLQDALAGGEKVTLIDLRPKKAYEKGTLPDALHMGVREALEKSLVGTVVFFDDGLSVNRARRAADLLTKAGKTAAELAGGYAAWRAAGFPTSERQGLSQRGERYVSYQDLTGALLEDASDIVLVDMREGASAPSRAPMAMQPEGGPAASGTTNAPSEVIDLSAELPGYRIVRQPSAADTRTSGLAAAAASPGTVEPLYILIDNGDGKAEKKASALRASGCTRVAVLAGGETIIRRKGEPGLLRRGPGTGLDTNEGLGIKNQATIREEVTP